MNRLLFLTIIIVIGGMWGIRPLQAANAVVGTGSPASCTEAAFNTALATVQSSGSGTITFNCGGAATIAFTSSKIISNATVTIDGGNNVTLNGGNAVRHFYVEANAFLTVKNIILKNGYDNTFGGGSILNLGGVSLNNATIRDSNVDSGHSGGGIMSYTLVLITNSIIENNTGGSAGGLFLFGEAADATITGSTFRNNRATNTSFGLGGAITVWDGADVTLHSTTLTQNQARSGGAIYNEFATSTIDINQNSTLTQNSATIRGGAIYASGGTFNLTDVVVSENTSNGDGGAFRFVSSVNANLTNVTIRDNVAGDDAGAISTEDSTLMMNNVTLDGNEAVDWGGGIWNDGGTITASNSAITNNSAKYGGGLYINSAETIELTTVTISNNTATNDGGGIWNDRLTATSSQVWSHLTIQNNASGGGGGGVFTKNGNFSINNAIISNNTSEYGGGIALEQGNLTLVSLTIRNNSALGSGSGYGGGIVLNETSTISLYDATISGNIAVSSGGGIDVGSGTLNVYTSTFNGNAASSGAAVATSNGSVIHLTNVTISQNSTKRGGGISFYISQSTLNYVTFYENTAVFEGSSIDLTDGTTTLKNVILQSSSGSNCEIDGVGITSSGFNLASDSSCNLNGVADLQNTDAQLGVLKDNGGLTLTQLPLPGSPALNSGQCVGTIIYDQRGITRPEGGTCDRGAVERKADDVDNLFTYIPLIIK